MSEKQRSQFFKVKPKPGLPLSAPGIAEGLAAIAKALERMNVLGGAVQWTDGVPTIIIGVGSDGSWKRLSDGGVDVPDCPVAEGTYFLRATVDAEGNCVKDWVEAIEADCGGGGS